uniref:Putative secreted protein n=1 Tax=Anopheles darlingi TaxID=43151 RepID=A0A2M4DNI9_ANODA
MFLFRMRFFVRTCAKSHAIVVRSVIEKTNGESNHERQKFMWKKMERKKIRRMRPITAHCDRALDIC